MIREVVALASKDGRELLRTRSNLLVTILLPMGVMIIFGTLFGGGETSSLNVQVAIVNQDNNNVTQGFIEGINQSGIFDLDLLSYKEAVESMTEEENIAFVVFPRGFGANISQGMWARVKVVIDNSRTASAQIANATLAGLFAELSKEVKRRGFEYAQIYFFDKLPERLPIPGMNVTKQDFLRYAIAANDPLIVERRGIVRDLEKAIDYILPGIFGFIVLFSGVYWSSGSLAFEKESGTFHRIALAPISGMVVLLGKFLFTVVLVVCICIAAAVVAVFGFGAEVVGSWVVAFLIVAVMAMNGASIGAIVASFAKKAETANWLSMMIAMPLQFMTGMWAAVESLPLFLQPVARAIPITHGVNALRNVMAKGYSLEEVMPAASLLIITTVTFLAIAVMVYNKVVLGSGRGQ